MLVNKNLIMKRKIKVGISAGDPNGVGYEVIMKALAPGMLELCTPVIFGNSKALQFWRKNLHMEEFTFQIINHPKDAVEEKANIINCYNQEEDVTPGTPTPAAGAASVKSLKSACDALGNGDIDVLVTAPICKQTANGESFPFPGHTEFLESYFGNNDKHSLMILFNDAIRVALVTTHLPISEVPSALTVDKIIDTARRFDQSLRLDFGVQRPRIAVLSLNPHGGDGGLLGKEEQEIIAPAIQTLRNENILTFGPIPSDGLFGSGAYKNFDGIIAMYHDQGLAPFKALAGSEGVNFTAGLPVVRTSPDHGTAFDIAAKGMADPQSMRQAIYSAIDIFRQRQNEKNLQQKKTINNPAEPSSTQQSES